MLQCTSHSIIILTTLIRKYLLFGVMHLKKPNFHCYLNVYCNVGEKYGILCLLSLCEISMHCEFQFGIFLVVMLLN